MLSEQEQEKVLRPFRTLAGRFESELESAKENLAAWEKARSINASGVEIANNDELKDKISQLEKGRTGVEELMLALAPKLKVAEDLNEITEGLENDRLKFDSILNTARSLHDHKYTVTKKNEMNRRITSINSSGMLNNADMAELQSRWTEILGMRNDRRLDMAKEAFENRLIEWEKLIAQKTLQVPRTLVF